MDLGPWLLGLGSWVLGLGSWIWALGSWALDLGSWLLDLGSWAFALGSWAFALGLCVVCTYAHVSLSIYLYTLIDTSFVTQLLAGWKKCLESVHIP